jgi:hypothetical protein
MCISKPILLLFFGIIITSPLFPIPYAEYFLLFVLIHLNVISRDPRNPRNLNSGLNPLHTDIARELSKL